jgi:hypothetical protein
MANYIELLKEYNYNPGEESTTGTRVFIQDPAGTITTLPAINDALPQNPAFTSDYPVPDNCLLRTINIVGYKSGTGQTDSSYKLVFNYNTKSSETSVPDPEDEPENLTIGGEFVQLPSFGGASATIFVTSNKPVKANVYQFVATAQYDKTQIYTTMQLAVDSIKNQIGRVQSGNTCWLSLGADISQFIDNEGDDAFKCVRRYSYKYIDHPEGAAGWNHVWDPQNTKFDKTTPLSYSSASFTDTLPTLGTIA